MALLITVTGLLGVIFLIMAISDDFGCVEIGKIKIPYIIVSAIFLGIFVIFCMFADGITKGQVKEATLTERVTELEKEVAFLKDRPRFVKLCEEWRYYTMGTYDYGCERYVDRVNEGDDYIYSFVELENQVEIMRRVKQLKEK